MAWLVPTLCVILWGVTTRTPTMLPGEPMRVADVATRPLVVLPADSPIADTPIDVPTAIATVDLPEP